MAIKIMLDAGHYGKYNRSPVVKEYYESEMNWKLHNYLKDELKSYGFVVGVTRTAKTKDLELYARGQKAKGYDLFLSLHSNAASTESADYPLGIYLVKDDSTDIDEKSKEIATLLANKVREVMGTKDAAKTMSRLCSFDRDGDGKVDDDYYGVLYGAHKAGVAGVILEHSFHTNTTATKWLLNDDNLIKLAKAEAAALAEYYGVKKATATTKDELYRVRKSWADAGSQLGAFKNLDGAKKVCKPGYKVFDSSGKVVYEPTPAVRAIKAGDTVMVKEGAKTYTGAGLADFVYKRKHKVKQIEGSRAVITYGGIVVAAIHKDNLILA